MTARKLLALPLAFTGGVILASFAACTETNDSHCSVKGGDVFCQEKTGRAEGEVFCTNNCGGDYDFDGCLVAEEAPADGCWLCEGTGSANCGSVGDGDSDSTDTTAESDSTDASETMDTETTAETGPECMDSSECPGELPLCEAGSCVGCGDGEMVSCASEYPEAPACDAGSGECKLCTGEDAALCMGVTPVCEGFACVGCDEHAQCPDSACNMSTGGCMDPDRVWWVDQSAAADGDGSEGNPFDELDDALVLIEDGEEGTIYLKTANAHQEQLQVVNGQTVAVVRKSPMGTLQNNVAAAINNGGTLFVQGVRISSSFSGISCTTGGVLWMNDVIVQSNMGRGVSVDECEAHMVRTSVLNNPQSGIRLVAGELEILNSIIGSDLNDVPAVDVVSGVMSISYSTIVAGLLTASSIKCGNQGVGSSVRNSLVVARTMGPEISQCDQISLTDNALESNMVGNVGLGDMDASWFADIAANDYHLAGNAPGEIADSAVWQMGDPAGDIDGDARPATEGSPDYAGADVPN